MAIYGIKSNKCLAETFAKSDYEIRQSIGSGVDVTNGTTGIYPVYVTLAAGSEDVKMVTGWKLSVKIRSSDDDYTGDGIAVLGVYPGNATGEWGQTNFSVVAMVRANPTVNITLTLTAAALVKKS